MSARFTVLVALAVALLVGACTSEREGAAPRMLVEVSSDLSVPAELDRLTLEVDGQQLEGPAEADLRTEGLPRRVTLVYESGPLGPVRIRVQGFSGATRVVEKVAAAWFPADGERRVPIVLARGCVGIACGEGETCDNERCVFVGDGSSDDAAVPDDGGVGDGGSGAGGGGNSDAGVPTDGGKAPDAAAPTDAGSGLADAGRDAGPPPPPPPGALPTCVIERPAPSDFVQVDTGIVLRGSCTDPETGLLMQSLVWTSQLDGRLGEGNTTIAMLRSAGDHRIQLCAPDPRDASKLGCASVWVTATVERQPRAQILSVTQHGSPALPFESRAPITLTGMGTGATVTLTWRDSVEGVVGEGTTATIVMPTAGLHVVTLVARDRDNRMDVATTTFLVVERGMTPPAPQ